MHEILSQCFCTHLCVIPFNTYQNPVSCGQIVYMSGNSVTSQSEHTLLASMVQFLGENRNRDVLLMMEQQRFPKAS